MSKQSKNARRKQARIANTRDRTASRKEYRERGFEKMKADTLKAQEAAKARIDAKALVGSPV